MAGAGLDLTSGYYQLILTENPGLKGIKFRQQNHSKLSPCVVNTD